MCDFDKRRWLVGERLHPPTAFRLISHVPLCQPHVSTRCGDSTSNHPANPRLLSPRRSSAILPECTSLSRLKSTRRPWRMRNADQVRFFGTDMTLSTWKIEISPSTPDTASSKEKLAGRESDRREDNNAPAFRQIQSTKASATRGDKHGGDPSHEKLEKLALRSTTIMEKVFCAATILHEDCRSFLHRSRLSSMSAMLSGSPLSIDSYQDSPHR